MSDAITDATYGMFRSILEGEHRYDTIFCQLVDQGLDPAEAAEKAKELVKEPVKPL